MKEKTIKKQKVTVIFNSDPGVDDALAHLLILSQTEKNSNITIAGMVPTVGNAVLEQTAVNVRRILELVQQYSDVYLGAKTPLGLENNVTEVNTAINATHFYGHDGLADQPPDSWPPTTIPLQEKKAMNLSQNLFLMLLLKILSHWSQPQRLQKYIKLCVD